MDKLHQSVKIDALDRLVSVFAHDVSNQIAIINGILEIAIDSNNEATSGKLLIAVEAANKTATIVENLLENFRVETIGVDEVDLNETFKDFKQLLPRTLGPHIDIIFNIDRLIKVLINEDMLHVVLLNLALNARDAMGSEGTLEISTGDATENEVVNAGLSLEKSYVKLEVSDTGKGIPSELKSRVFDQFFTTKSAARGCGLGLSQVYAFVIQSRGSITYSSKVGKGTKFKILLEEPVQPLKHGA